MKLLDFVAFYGFILAPIGAIIVFEHFLLINLAFKGKTGLKFNYAVPIVWGGTFTVFYYISIQFNVFLSFFTLPAWISCGIVFMILSKCFQNKNLD